MIEFVFLVLSMPVFTRYFKNCRFEVNKNIVNDLELVETVDTSCNSIYTFCFDNDNDISKKLNQQIVKYYTTDAKFI